MYGTNAWYSQATRFGFGAGVGSAQVHFFAVQRDAKPRLGRIQVDETDETKKETSQAVKDTKFQAFNIRFVQLWIPTEKQSAKKKEEA